MTQLTISDFDFLNPKKLVIYSVIVYLPLVATADASDEYVEDRDMLLLALIVVASVRLFTSEAEGVMSAAAVIAVVVGLATVPPGPAMVAISSTPRVDIELDDCEDEFSR